ncbi:MAG: phenylalanine--tRNA ligase subunit alpha [Desulfurococcaceae archaeon]
MNKEIYVTPRQYELLKAVISRQSISIGELAEILGVKQEDLMRDLTELETKQLLKTSRSTIKHYVVSNIGLYYLEHGLPEEIVYNHLVDKIGYVVNELLNEIVETKKISRNESEIGLLYLVREKCVEIESGQLKVINPDNCNKLFEQSKIIKKSLIEIIQGKEPNEYTMQILRRRKLVETKERTIINISPTHVLIGLWTSNQVKPKTLLTIVKPEHAPYIEQYIIKEFDLSIEPPTPLISRKHPFMQFIHELREIMISLGFEEVKGPHVEAEFWNFDALFQAQDHPAREIHDTFFIKTSLKAQLPEELLKRTKVIHEVGWGYEWSPERAMRLVLRSQTTAVSARAIYQRGPGEYRVFTIDRNFRPENLDAKHSMEFYQLDGVIVGKNVNFKHLLYFFKELSAALGIKEIWFKPGYFPFTEPSVEGYIKHPKLGWIEVFPGGMFRPEVMEILGASGYNAAAWGIGVDRLAMTVLGLDDIRLLFTRDLDILSSIRYPGLPFFLGRTSGRDIKVHPAPL